MFIDRGINFIDVIHFSFHILCIFYSLFLEIKPILCNFSLPYYLKIKAAVEK